MLSQAVDVDGDALTAVLVSGPTTGSLTLNSDGSWTYTPQAGFIGTASFQFAAFDGTATSAASTVAIDIVGGIVSPTPGTEPTDNSTDESGNTDGDNDDTDDSDGNSGDGNESGTDVNETGVALGENEDKSSADAKPNPNRNRLVLGAVSNPLFAGGDSEDTIERLRELVFSAALSEMTWVDDAFSKIELIDDPFQLEERAQLKFSQELKVIQAAMERFERQISEQNAYFEVSSGAATGVFVGATAGIAVWAMSGTYLASLVFSAFPAWARLDPILVVNQTLESEDDTSVAEIINDHATLNSEVNSKA